VNDRIRRPGSHARERGGRAAKLRAAPGNEATRSSAALLIPFRCPSRLFDCGLTALCDLLPADPPHDIDRVFFDNGRGRGNEILAMVSRCEIPVVPAIRLSESLTAPTADPNRKFGTDQPPPCLSHSTLVVVASMCAATAALWPIDSTNNRSECAAPKNARQPAVNRDLARWLPRKNSGIRIP